MSEELLDDIRIGSLVDSEDGIDQSELNEDLLYDNDKIVFLNKIGRYTDKYEINNYLEIILDEEIGYWTTILLELINIYSLDVLNIFVSTIIEGSLDNSRETKKLIISIKNILLNMIESGKFTKTIKRNELLDLVNAEKIDSYYLKYFLTFTDRENYNKFIYKIFSEFDEFSY